MASFVLSQTFSVTLISACLLPAGRYPHSLSFKPYAIRASQPTLLFSRRLALPLLSLPLFLSPFQPAFAKDIPLFGLRKRLEQAEKEAVLEVEELVKEGKQLVKKGEKEVGSVAGGAVTAFSTSPLDAGGSIPPAYQAAAVAGVELVAVLIAASFVNDLVSEERR